MKLWRKTQIRNFQVTAVPEVTRLECQVPVDHMIVVKMKETRHDFAKDCLRL
jgi:hypothetical protein